MDKSFFKDKSVLIMGLGRFGGGVDSALFAHRCGGKVTVTDTASADKLTDPLNKLGCLDGIRFSLGGHIREDFENNEIVIVNPAVRNDNKFLKAAGKNNKFITTQINIFLAMCPAKTVGITGSNGKSTTTALTSHLLRAGTQTPIWTGGNIGNKPLLCILDEIKPADIVVLELSSFQLERLSMTEKSVDVSLITNLSPNHLDYHGTFENYCNAKENIFRFQKADKVNPCISIFNANDKILQQWHDRYSHQCGRICKKFCSTDISENIRSNFRLPGAFNLSNLAAAAAISDCFAVSDDSICKSAAQFKALPHRLELIAEIDSVKWYNDSISTTVESTTAAIDAFSKPKIVIAGGYDKGTSFEQLGSKLAEKTKAVILIGKTAEKIVEQIYCAKEVKTEVLRAENLQQAVEMANKLAVSGDIILLSPACASYDMFDNFQHRGDQFVRLVNSLIC